MTYQIIELAEDAPTQLEQLGTKTKFWYRDENGQRAMFNEEGPEQERIGRKKFVVRSAVC